MTREEFHILYANPREITVGDMATSLLKCAIFALYCHLKLEIDNPEGLKSDLRIIANSVSCYKDEILKDFQEYIRNEAKSKGEY